MEVTFKCAAVAAAMALLTSAAWGQSADAGAVDADSGAAVSPGDAGPVDAPDAGVLPVDTSGTARGEPGPAATIRPATGAAAGRVLLPWAGEPADGAEVSLRGPGGRSHRARTGVDGRFRIDALPPGRYLFTAEMLDLSIAKGSIVVAPAETAELVITLTSTLEVQAEQIQIRGKGEAERLRDSARAVTVIETGEAKQRTADLGEVMARSQGVGVRRGGGLGSGTRFSLHGLTDEQIRFFVDGVPLELAGYPFGFANVPVNLVERAEVYRGVVPIELGADALGGAVDFITDDKLGGTHGALSYQAGSFGTHRATLTARHLFEPRGVFARASGFFDYADNDYPVDVEVADDRGRLVPARVHRFHDAYRASGVNLETGVIDRPWARRLLVRAFLSSYDKELQNNVVMTVPYGDVEIGERATGATLRYEQRVAERVSLELVGGYSYTVAKLLDVGTCVYDWYGRCVWERQTAGEIDSQPRDQILWSHGAYFRAGVGVDIAPQHAVRMTMAPTVTNVTGDERRQADPDARDPLTAESDLVSLVTGLEYEADLFGDRLENVVFIKDYLQLARAEEPVIGGAWRDRDRNTHRVGVGNALRYRVLESLDAKLSYEWATRLPRPDELFGNGLLVAANLDLAPEVSHNFNAGFAVDTDDGSCGRWRAELHGFLRDAEQLMVLLGNDRVLRYQNVFGARSLGFDTAASWTSPGDLFGVDGNLTYLDFRNTSSDGAFGAYEGDRIPNRPYLFANAGARVRLRGVAAERDALTLAWHTRYVHEFFRGWESVGLEASKQVIPTQLLSSVSLSYRVEGDQVSLGQTLELSNLTDEPAYDFFGVQRPGRAIYFKSTAEF